MNVPPEKPPSDPDWQAWLDQHGAVFFLYARQQTRSESDAKDVFQDVLVETWVKARGTIPDKAVVLATIRRRSIDLGRSIDRRVRREQTVATPEGSWFVPDFDANDTRRHLVESIQQLPDDLREVLILRMWGDLSFPAIASLTDVPVPTATSRYRYALDHLRRTLVELQP
ncbi:hypothetical protein HAHE_25650 [Haloferula helveola]|uniref:RNA polymerase sigma factor 70 region 4 type 2 domain-containing protein n=1 Tax=Haloferula helveola TaxID=490095 RepID=A0ABM7RGY7_9BACT|nr:hypothetical protein HAHE_25650 [Haloferula helveola]